MKQLGKAISEMSQKDISALEKNGSHKFAELPGEPVVTLEDVEVIPEDVRDGSWPTKETSLWLLM